MHGLAQYTMWVTGISPNMFTITVHCYNPSQDNLKIKHGDGSSVVRIPLWGSFSKAPHLFF